MMILYYVLRYDETKEGPENLGTVALKMVDELDRDEQKSFLFHSPEFLCTRNRDAATYLPACICVLLGANVRWAKSWSIGCEICSCKRTFALFDMSNMKILVKEFLLREFESAESVNFPVARGRVTIFCSLSVGRSNYESRCLIRR